MATIPIFATLKPVLKTISIVIISLFIRLFFVSPALVSAQDPSEFTTDMTVTYTVDASGDTQVHQQIILTNNLPSIYATQYQLEIGSGRITQIAVETPDGRSIPFSQTRLDTHTLIEINFADKIVGKGKQRIFIIKYVNPDAAQKNGQVLQVAIPRLSQPERISNYAVKLIIPLEYGPPRIVTPETYILSTDPAFTTIEFAGLNTKTAGIVALFGQSQSYQISATYFLTNPTITPIVTQIALPPDTSYQRVLYHNLTPQPTSIATDPDGNWIATYSLEPKQQLTVTADLTATVSLDPQNYLPPPENISTYLTEQKYWPVNDKEIKTLAENLHTPQEVYNYVVSTLSYNFGRLDNQSTHRLGALAALKAPQNALCQEFTDTFVTLARAAGIPARAVTGYAITDNPNLKPLSLIQDVLHAWPEYYDREKSRWIPIDPTWADTTGGLDYFNHLDFNHISFAIQGAVSDRPLPAGFYNLDPPQKLIKVDVLSLTPEPRVDYTVAMSPINFRLNPPSLITTLHLTNRSTHAWYNPPITVTIPPAAPESISTASVVLPFQTVTIPLRINLKNLNQSLKGSLTVYDVTQNFTQDTPITFQTIALPGIVVALVTSGAFLTRSILVYRRKK